MHIVIHMESGISQHRSRLVIIYIHIFTVQQKLCTLYSTKYLDAHSIPKYCMSHCICEIWLGIIRLPQ